MKKLLQLPALIIVAALIPACGIANKITCPSGDLELICHAIFGQPVEEKEPEVLKTDIEALITMIEALESSNSESVAAMNDLIQEMLIRITELETGNSVIQVINPCTPSNGFDEVLLRIEDGTLIAYFESGSQRFLTVLKPGNYKTTDARQCNFSVGPAPEYEVFN